MLQQRKSVVKLTSVTEESQEDIRYDVSCTAYRPLSPLAPLSLSVQCVQT